MKILVISLLRLGDVLLATSVVRGLKRAYPQAEISILINKQFASVADMIPDVSKVYFFDRTGVQNMLGHKDHSLLEAYYRVEDLVDELKSEGFDQVINLTHNRLSGWIATLIDCQDTRGVMFRKDGKLSLGSSWFQYLNENAQTQDAMPFHFVDVFHYGIGLNQLDRRLQVKESARGKRFADQFFSKLDSKRVILVQASSHEKKKTLAASQWLQIIKQYRDSDSLAEIFVMGSKDEKAWVESICRKELRIQPLICQLDEAFSVLKRAQLLLTVDTSIKHLASAAGTKIIEISIGSSDYLKTGTFTDGALIIQGMAPCAPCPHSTDCTQTSHICAINVDPMLVVMAMRATLNRDDGALRILAHEYKDQAILLRTHVSSTGDWSAYPLASAFKSEKIGSWVDRISQKLQLQEVHKQSIGEYGTESLELRKLLTSMYPDQSYQDWQKQLKDLESDFSFVGEKLVTLMKELKEALAHFGSEESLNRYLQCYEEAAHSIRQFAAFKSYAHELDEIIQTATKAQVPFTAIAQIRERLSKAYQRYKIELKLIRGLQTDFMEII